MPDVHVEIRVGPAADVERAGAAGTDQRGRAVGDNAPGIDLQRSRADCRAARVGVGSGEYHRARAGFAQRTRAADHIGQGQAVGAVDGKRGVIGDVARHRAGVVQLERARADRRAAGVGVRRAQGCRARAELLYDTIAGNGGGDRGRIALVKVDHARARAESNARRSNRSRGVIGAKATDVQRGRGPVRRCDGQTRAGRSVATVGYCENVAEARVADKEAEGVAPAGARTRDQHAVIVGGHISADVAVNPDSDQSAVRDDHAVAAVTRATDEEIERVVEKSVCPRDQHAVVQRRTEGSDLADRGRHRASIGDDEAVAAAVSSDIEVAAVGPDGIRPRDQRAVVGGKAGVADAAFHIGDLAPVADDQAVAAAVKADNQGVRVGQNRAGTRNVEQVVRRVGRVADISVIEAVGARGEVRRDVGGIGTNVEVLGATARHGQKENGAEHRGEGDGAFHRGLLSGRA